MTPENQAYCDRYVQMWGFYSPFTEDFTQENYFIDFHTYLLYFPLVLAEGRRRSI
jgi:hypothetical protein